MKLSLYIALRYLFAKKSQNVINIISGVSVIGVAVGTMALITILSVFNGFDFLIRSLFNAFDPDIKISAVHGKAFSENDERLVKVYKMQGVKYYSEVIEDNALLRCNERNFPAIVKGVGKDFIKMTGIDTMMISGSFMLRDKNVNYAVLGRGVAYHLGAGPGSFFPISVYVPRRNSSPDNPAEAFTIKSVYPSGVFSIQQDFDMKYIIVPIEFARELFEYPDKVTSIAIRLEKGVNANKVQNEIRQILGSEFSVKNRYEQNELLFKVMNSEKWAIFFILTFILLIASFNVLGSLTMLIIDKKNDIGILQSLGADKKMLGNIFLFEGWMISIIGALMGLLFGFIICFLQIKFGFVKLSGGGSFIINAYPVSMQLLDFVYVFITVLFIGFLASWYPVRYMTKRYLAFE